MIKYIKNKNIPHIQDLEKHQFNYWFHISNDYIELFETGDDITLPQYYLNCRITKRYINRYYPEYLI